MVAQWNAQLGTCSPHLWPSTHTQGNGEFNHSSLLGFWMMPGLNGVPSLVLWVLVPSPNCNHPWYISGWDHSSTPTRSDTSWEVVYSHEVGVISGSPEVELFIVPWWVVFNLESLGASCPFCGVGAPPWGGGGGVPWPLWGWGTYCFQLVFLCISISGSKLAL